MFTSSCAFTIMVEQVLAQNMKYIKNICSWLFTSIFFLISGHFMKIINFWFPVLIIAFDILPLWNWIIYDYNGIDVTVSKIGFFQEIDIEWKISFINTSCGGNAAMYEPLFMSLRIPRKKMKFLVNFNEGFLLKHI